MFAPSKRKSRGVLAALSASALLAPLALAGPAGATVHRAGRSTFGAEYGFSTQAYSTYATAGGKVLSAASAATSFACSTKSQTQSNSSTGVSLGVGNSSAGALSNQVSQTTSGNTSSATAASTTHSVNLLGGLVKAGAVTQRAIASETSGSWGSSGSATFTGLTIGGKSESANPAPNTKIGLAGIGTAYLNYQVKSASKTGSSMNSDAIVVEVTVQNSLGVPVGATIVLGHASVIGAGPLSGTLGGSGYGTAVSGPEGTTGSSYPVAVDCMGSSTNQNAGAGVSFGPLTTGVISDTATGTDTATSLSAMTSSTVSNLKVAGILSFGGAKANASAAKSGSGVSTSGSVTLTNPKLLGTSVPVLPAHPSANYTVKINGVTLVMNRQVKTTNGITVQALYLTGQSIGTIVVGSASAYAYPGG
jgi:hypothetical protein